MVCVLADDAKRLLGKSATWKEEFVLGGARFYNDITITHSDHEYFDKICETKFNPVLCAEPKMEDQDAQIKFTRIKAKDKMVSPGAFAR